MSDELNSFLSEAATLGTLKSEGSFSIDLEKAREKTISRSLNQPRMGLLKLVQASVLGGATALKVRLMRQELQLDILGSDELVKQAENASEPLSVALWSSLYSGFREIRVETANISWSLTKDGFQSTHSQKFSNGVRIRLLRERKDGFWNNLKSLLVSRINEYSYLEDRLEHCHLPLELDKVVINRPAQELENSLAFRLQLIGPPVSGADEVFGGNYGFSGANLTYRGNVKIQGPPSLDSELFASFQTSAQPELFDAHWTAAQYVGSGHVLAELLLPAPYSPQQTLVFVKNGVEVGKVRYPLQGVVSACAVDVDASGLQLVNNPRLARFLERLGQVVSEHVNRLKTHQLPPQVRNALEGWSSTQV